MHVNHHPFTDGRWHAIGCDAHVSAHFRSGYLPQLQRLTLERRYCKDKNTVYEPVCY